MSPEKPVDGSELGMDAICRFSGHLAHELNNLLTPIVACGQMLRDSIKKDDPLYFCAEQIADAGDRCLGLSRKLQIIGSKRTSGHVLDVASLFREAYRTIKLPSDRTIKIVEEFPGAATDSDFLARVDMEQFFFMIGELIGNAIDAMPQGGEIQMGVSLDQPAGDVTPGDAPDGWIKLTIKDQGSGMTPEVAARMYEPYFSTHGHERDKGLGLTLVYGIVKRSGGVIECKTAPGAGTSFNLFFPRKTDSDNK